MTQKIVHIVLFLQSNAGAPVNNLGKPVNIVVIFKNFMRLPCRVVWQICGIEDYHYIVLTQMV